MPDEKASSEAQHPPLEVTVRKVSTQIEFLLEGKFSKPDSFMDEPTVINGIHTSLEYIRGVDASNRKYLPDLEPKIEKYETYVVEHHKDLARRLGYEEAPAPVAPPTTQAASTIPHLDHVIRSSAKVVTGVEAQLPRYSSTYPDYDFFLVKKVPDKKGKLKPKLRACRTQEEIDTAIGQCVTENIEIIGAWKRVKSDKTPFQLYRTQPM